MENHDPFYSQYTITTVGELIDAAFGDPKTNIVHHKMIQAILFLLANHVRLLQRKVYVPIDATEVERTDSTLTVTEVTLKAKLGESDKKPGIKKPGSDKKDEQWKSALEKKRDERLKTEREKKDETGSDKKKDKRSKSDPDKKEDERSKYDSKRKKDEHSKPESDKKDGLSITESEIKRGERAKSESEKKKARRRKTGSENKDELLTPESERKRDKRSKSDPDKKKDKRGKTESKKKDEHRKSKSKKAQDIDLEQIISLTSETEEPGIQAYTTPMEPPKRTDSREDQRKSLTPMKSMDSVEAKYEKLLVVQRVSTGEAKIRAAKEMSGARKSSDTSISIVTQEQFQDLTAIVRQIQKAFGVAHGKPEFPENMQLMQELRRGASLTDAMSALQLSARLEATEKTIGNLVSIVTAMATNFGIDTEGGKGPASEEKSELLSKQLKTKQKAKTDDRVDDGTGIGVDEIEKSVGKTVSSMARPSLMTKKSEIKERDFVAEEVRDPVYLQELDATLTQFYDSIMQEVRGKVARSTANTENTFKLAKRLEAKLDASQNLGDKMEELEAAVIAYSTRINHLDKTLASQMTDYQEELTQMQHDLECGLETMADTLANTGGDATAVAELNMHFNDLQLAIDTSFMKQKELREMQREMSEDFARIREQIEILRETKADRDEVEDALRDKAGLKELNGMVNHAQFDAIRGDYQKEIVTAYEKFNSQELVWQKIIDEIERTLYDKADIIQVVYLKDEINHHLNALNDKVKSIMEVVGEPKAAAVSKVIHRDAACISCSTPAHMALEQITIPKLPAVRPPAIGAERGREKGPKEDGDHGKCYPGYPIPHPIDPRARVCRRWCGGSHTVISNNGRAPPGLVVTSPCKINEELGTDGRMYAVDAPKERQPCSPCAIDVYYNKKVSLEDTQHVEARHSDMTPPDYIPNYSTTMMNNSDTSMNAPMFEDQ